MKKAYANMDLLEEIRAIRTELMREFKTLDALCDHLDENPPLKQTPASSRNGHRMAVETDHRPAARRRKAPARA